MLNRTWYWIYKWISSKLYFRFCDRQLFIYRISWNVRIFKQRKKEKILSFKKHSFYLWNWLNVLDFINRRSNWKNRRGRRRINNKFNFDKFYSSNKFNGKISNLQMINSIFLHLTLTTIKFIMQFTFKFLNFHIHWWFIYINKKLIFILNCKFSSCNIIMKTF